MYDIFLFTGPSPINTPYFGLEELLRPRKAIADRIRQQKEDGLV